jgi:hypothetical protein
VIAVRRCSPIGRPAGGPALHTEHAFFRKLKYESKQASKVANQETDEFIFIWVSGFGSLFRIEIPIKYRIFTLLVKKFQLKTSFKVYNFSIFIFMMMCPEKNTNFYHLDAKKC